MKYNSWLKWLGEGGRPNGVRPGESILWDLNTNSEQLGILLENYSNNHGILPNYPLFIKGGKEIRLL